MKTKKCFSKCRKIPEDACKEKKRFCQFTKGTRKYCRISKFYALDEKCDMYLKLQKKKKLMSTEATQKIARFIRTKRTRNATEEPQKEPTEEPSNEAEALKKIGRLIRTKQTRNALKETQNKIAAFKNKVASKKIARFMMETKPKRQALFLKSLCSDSGVCVAFGTEINKINEFFNNFTDFNYAVSIKKIGAVSANGFVKEITYRREGYESFAVLKSSAKPKSDNLMYEYEVGHYINKQNKIFPCFLETYGLFLYKNAAAWSKSKAQSQAANKATAKATAESLAVVALRDGLTLSNAIDYSVGCPKSRDIAILIQHIKGAKTLSSYMDDAMDLDPLDYEKSINYELPSLLYQIYMPLEVLKSEFTHYDLHYENVLLYKPIKDGYITFHYHLASGEVVKFNSQYIAKIIDYGRSYYDDGAKNAKSTYENICKIKECKPKCGKNYGVSWLGPEAYPGGSYYISTQVPNVSHDLRLLNIVKAKFSKIEETSAQFKRLLNKVVYKTNYGTNERTVSGMPDDIYNVADAESSLRELIKHPYYMIQNDREFAKLKNVGALHIYADRRPMRFDKA